MLDVITLGSATIDVFVNTENQVLRKKHGCRTDKLLAYPLGTKIVIKELFYETGGGGTNTAVAFSRLGLKTGYLGELGKEGDSRTILEVLRKNRVQFLGKKEKGKAGYSIILDSVAHDRTILTFKGSNNDFTISDRDMRKLSPRCFYFSSMMGKSFATAKKIALYAKKKGITLAFNPSSYQAKFGKKALMPIISRTTILLLNDEEAEYIVGKGTIEQNLKRLHALGPKIVVITQGCRGVHAYDGKNIYYIKPRNVRVVEATGAGDAYSSAFVAAILKGEPAAIAMQIGQVEAESVLRHIGAKNKLLTWKEAMHDIKKKRIEVIIRKA